MGVCIVPRVQHFEDHNSGVDDIVAYDMRIDLLWVHKDNGCFTKLKLLDTLAYAIHTQQQLIKLIINKLAALYSSIYLKAKISSKHYAKCF